MMQNNIMELLIICSFLCISGVLPSSDRQISRPRHERKQLPKNLKQTSKGTNIKVQKSLLKATQPEQVHISFGEKINDIVVIWATRQKVEEPYLQYGNKVENLKKSYGKTELLTKSNADGAKYWHRVYLADLIPGEKYLYRVSAKGTWAPSETFDFIVPPTTMSPVHSVMVLADMGSATRNLHFIVHQALNFRYEAVIHIGDIAYDLHRGEGLVGDTYLKKIEKMAAKVPYMTCPGDHERFKDFVHYRYRFSMPGIPWPMPRNKLWYSYNIGHAHFIALNTESFFTQTDLKAEQIDWLKNDLKKANLHRSHNSWVIVLGHRPMYSSCNKKEVECREKQPAFRKELDDIFYKEGVDLYISGHQHNYERTWPVYREKAFALNYKNPLAPVHITIGALGNVYMQDKFTGSVAAWSSLRISEMEKELYGKLDIINASHLLWEVFSAHNNEQIDKRWIVQWRHGTYGMPGEEAYKKAMEQLQIPMQPPVPPGYGNKRLDVKRQGYLGPAQNMLVSADGSEMQMCLSLLTIAIFALLVCLFSGRIRKKLRACLY